MTATKKTSEVISSRRTYIDWLRGIAVLCMVEWHAVDAWTLNSERAGAAFKVLAYLGGWAAPLFLFLAGLAIPLAAEANIRKGMSVREAAWALQKRGWQIFLLAHLFKLQSYLLNPYAFWHGIFKPDILNVLGLGMVVTAFCWGRAETLRGRLVWLLTPAMFVLALTPIVRGWWWPTLLHPRLEAYIRPNGFGQFAVFPWTTYVLLGAALGLWVAMQRTSVADRRFHGYLAAAGLLLVVAGSLLWPPWSAVVTRTGGMIVALVVAWLWMQRPGAARWSPIVVFGQTSLFVYWVHVELAYGQFTQAIKRGLTVPEALFAYAIFIGLLLWAANAWKNWKGPWIPPRLAAQVAGLLIVASWPMTMGASGQEQWRPVAVRLPAETPVSFVSSCQTDTGAAALRPSDAAPGQSDAQCALATIARCSIPGTEPIDIDLGSLCRGGMARIEPAPRAVVPVWPSPAAVTVEWRAWSDSVTSLLASRTIDPAQATTLPVARATRLLRVVRPGTSPVTLVVPAMEQSPEDIELTIPAAEPGGELFLAFDERERQSQTLTLRGPETRLIGINGAQFLSFSGLAPGNYTLRFGTPDVPEGRPLELTIRAGATTEVVPRLPATITEFRISGLVTFNGEPLPRQPLEVTHTTTDETVTTTTDDRGRYAITLADAGVYRVRVVSTHDSGHLEAQREVALGETVIDLDLTGANVRLVFLVNGATPSSPVTFVIEGPQRFSATVVDVQQPFDILAVPFGSYAVRASMDPQFVSEAVPMVIDSTPGMRLVTLDLREQRATLRVQEDGGGMVPNVRARAGGQILRLSDTGNEFDVRRVSPGTPILVRAPLRVPACIVLAPDSENLVRLRSDVAAQTVLFPTTGLRVPPGRVRLNEADTCTVPLEEFEWRRVEGGFEIINLPNGSPATLEYGTQTFTLRAPGEAVVVR